MLARVAGGWRFQSHPDLAPYVERFVLDGQPARLSPAALETLAIVAYKQPVSRAQVAAIRGVNADGVMRTLSQRGYVEEVGRDPGPGPGRALRHHAGCSWSGSGSTRWPTCRRWATSCPAPRWSRPSSGAWAPTTRDRPGRPVHDPAEPGERLQKVLAARRPRQPAGVRGSDRRRSGSPSTARSPSWAGGSTRRPTASRSTACRVPVRPGLVYLPAQQAARAW